MTVIRAFCAVLLFAATAQAHEHPDHWIGQNRYKNAAGELCCGDNDCKLVPAEGVKETPSGYRMPSGEIVPYAAVLPSEDGHFWECIWGTPPQRKCLFGPRGGV